MGLTARAAARARTRRWERITRPLTQGTRTRLPRSTLTMLLCALPLLAVMAGARSRDHPARQFEIGGAGAGRFRSEDLPREHRVRPSASRDRGTLECGW